MCGRFSFHLSDLGIVAAAFGITLPESLAWAPRYNIAPTQDAPVVTHSSAGPALQMQRWGLVPHWASDPAVGSRAINARIEGAADKPTFRDAVQRRRCIVPATGYFEWKRLGPRDKQPMWIHPPDDGVMWLAGMWARWSDGAEQAAPLHSFTLLTQPASGAVSEVHDRMPVELGREAALGWLDPTLPGRKALALAEARSGSTDRLLITPVSKLVNSPGNDSSACIAPEAPRRARTQLSMEDLLGEPD